MKVLVMATDAQTDEVYMVRGMAMDKHGEVEKLSVQSGAAISKWRPVTEFNLVPITIETDGGRKL